MIPSERPLNYPSHLPFQEGSQVLLDKIRDILSAHPVQLTLHQDEVTLWVEPSHSLWAFTLLRDHTELKFRVLLDICAVDFLGKVPVRFQVVYHLLSLHDNHRIRVKLWTDGKDPIPSLTSLFPSANWYEREVWDLFGISFKGHPDLRRLLTDYGFEGHPLRKDFPLWGHKEVFYEEKTQQVTSGPVSLTQDYREFDFLSPWEGTVPSLKAVSSPSPSVPKES